ncbi:MAG: VWA domain-containing protein [Candidatus Nanopelagicales bacterium]|nr:VWA domain-containing protein [Candidatus Nanopelagicales bacterium]MCF8536907.1 VWA domain-containing protein [Candidatus Nanopelagicales bacterium]MCF8542037.1 VWA domain-containing protein [Candidatus Nanopelagicales bacterium]MCF8556725.1 VWA domain-containing protein [Candidatus Nanopelagicales bacterium]
MGGRGVADDLFTGIVSGFGQLLHSAGVPVTPERSVRFARAIGAAQPQTVDEVYWLGRTTLLTDHGQIEIYDRVFSQIFRGIVDLADSRGQSQHAAPPDSAPAGERSPNAQERAGDPGGSSKVTSATPGESSDDSDGEEEDPQVLAAVSESERLADRDFAACTEEELALIRRLVDQLPVVPPPRVGRRLRRHASGRRLDVRGTLRRSHRTGGDPVDMVMRKQAERPRRVVLIADVSGSMEPYARVYLHLMRGAVQALRAEAFVFATRLTRLTRALALTHPDVAYRKAVDAAPDWSGGTRIGRALASFLDEYGRRGMARGAVIVIVSDGWEIDGVDMVATSMQRMSRLAHHVIWVNPRKAAESYEPLVGGMAAALPFIDTFISGHSLRALEEVMEAIRNARERSPAKAPAARVSA